MRTVLPLDALYVDQLQVGFVDERRGLQTVPGALPRHTSPCDPMQLTLDERDQPLECRIIALSPGQQQSRYVARHAIDEGDSMSGRAVG
jgi:hypothetical protein